MIVNLVNYPPSFRDFREGFFYCLGAASNAIAEDREDAGGARASSNGHSGRERGHVGVINMASVQTVGPMCQWPQLHEMACGEELESCGAVEGLFIVQQTNGRDYWICEKHLPEAWRLAEVESTRRL